ncbi:MAG: hypothetical protein AB7N71_07740 [Phycisphaerae bacterium]
MPDSDKIIVRCAGCSAKLGLPAKVAGKKIKCPKCEAPLRVPGGAPREDATSARRKAATAPVHEAVPAGTFSDELGLGLLEQLDTGDSLESSEERLERFEARQEKRKKIAEVAKSPKKTRVKEKSTSGAKFDAGPWVVNFFGAFLKRDMMSYATRIIAFGGICLFGKGIFEARLADKAFAEPQDITCYQLGLQGPGDNAHVRMSDFILLEDYVYTEGAFGWEGAYVPAISQEDINRQVAAHWRVPIEEIGSLTYEQRNAALVALRNSFKFHVIVSFPQAGDAGYVSNRFEDEVLQGVVLGSVPEDVQRLLAGGFDGIRMGDCHVLEYGREPRTAASIQNFFWGGGAAILAAICLAGYRASTS